MVSVTTTHCSYSAKAAADNMQTNERDSISIATLFQLNSVRVPLLFVRDTFQDPSVDAWNHSSTKPFIYYVFFLYIHAGDKV